jgi:hypothetical protein
VDNDISVPSYFLLFTFHAIIWIFGIFCDYKLYPHIVFFEFPLLADASYWATQSFGFLECQASLGSSDMSHGLPFSQIPVV